MMRPLRLMPAVRPEGQGTGLVHDRGREVGAVDGGFGLSERRLERAEIADAFGAPGGGQHGPVEREHLAQGRMAPQARRRYRSRFWARMRLLPRWTPKSGH